MPAPDRWSIATLRASHDRLRALVEPLPVDALEGPSFDSDWTIAQVLSHLGSQAEIMDSAFVAIRDGGEAPGRDTMPAIWDQWNAMSAEEQRAGNLARNEAAVEHLEALSDDQVEHLQISLFDGFFQVDVDGFARLRLTEHTYHSWDIAVALDPTATLPRDATEVLLGSVPTLVGRFANAEATPLQLRVDLTDPDRSYALVVGAESSLEPWAEQDVTGTLRLPAETFLRLLAGRAQAGDPIELDADGVTLADVRGAFPGY